MDRPVQLHVMHSWGGGLEKWVKDYCHADNSRKNIILKSIGTWGAFGQRLELYLDVEDKVPHRKWIFASPIHGIALGNVEYKKALFEIINEYEISSIFVSSLIGHSLDVLDTKLATIKICHDFHPFCPAIYAYFNEVCHKCTKEKLELCLGQNKITFFKNLSANEAIQIRKKCSELILKNSIKMVAPSKFIRNFILDLDPSLEKAEFEVIPHGVNPPHFLPENSTGKTRPRAIVLGRLSTEKGGELLKECCKEITRHYDLYLIGAGKYGLIFKGQPKIHMIQKYNNEDLPRIINEISPDIGFLLSIVPETFSYTLSELFHFEIPVIATNAGSFTDRIVDEVNGFIIEPQKDELINLIERITKSPEALKKIKINLKNEKTHNVEAMVEEYHKIVPSNFLIHKRHCLKVSEKFLFLLIILKSPRTLRKKLSFYLFKKTKLNMIEITIRKNFYKIIQVNKSGKANSIEKVN